MITKAFFKIPFYGYTISHKTNSPDAIIFLHDALGSIEIWKDFPLLISKKTNKNAWLYDRRGHGKSKEIKKNSSLYYMHKEAEDLHIFIKHNNLKKPILIGSSDGGTIALLYASKYPTKAIISLAGHYKVDLETVKGVDKTKENTQKIIKKLTKMHGKKTSQLVKNWQNIWTSAVFSKFNISEELKKINSPTLLIQGENDQYASKTHSDEIAKIIGKNAFSYFIKNTGHFPHIQAKKITLNLIINFINNKL